MKLKLNKEKTTTFIKSGLLTLSAIILLALGFNYLPSAVYTMKQNNDRKLPIYCVDCNDCKVAISFDAAWGNDDTADILKILEKYNVKATFFMTGGWIESYPDDVKAIAAAGHDLANHSENHKQMSQLSKSECIAEIKKSHDKVKELTGVDMKLFRPPYGDYNNTLLESLEECNYSAIQWDVDSLDWKNYGVDSIINTVVNHKHLGNGSIILMHNGATYTKDALPKVIEGLQAKGYELVPISELVLSGDYHIDHEGRQCAD